MKFLLNISLILTIGFLNLVVMPAAQPMPLSIPQVLNQQSEGQNLIREEGCFSQFGIKGIKECQNLIEEDQSNSVVWNRLGRILYDLESYEAAYLSFKHAISLSPDYVLAWANVCAALRSLQDYEKALDACDTALHFSSDLDEFINEKVLALNNKAVALYSLARYQDSIDTIDEALALKPDDMYVRLNRMVILHNIAHAYSSTSEDLTL
ncbi:MAG: hypothetical protein F6K30_03890 [Cyanothece sp. SIO2G6]|nr:hypothetical protein [Cyanothece sp. SIO2G6]